MASFAHLKTSLRCPFCNSEVTNELWFMWGYCATVQPVNEFVYRLGDAIRWKKCENETVLSWAYFGPSAGNKGDPAIQDLIVKDSGYFFDKENPCKSCGEKFGGAAIEIRNGKIHRAWIYKIGELDEQTDIYLIKKNSSLISLQETETLVPMPEWDDLSMSTQQ